MAIKSHAATRYAEWREWLEPKYPAIFDWSHDAMNAFHAHQTHGTRINSGIFNQQPNGYEKAHSLINFHITEWRADYLAGQLFKHEIFDDHTLPIWLRESFRAAVNGVFVENFLVKDFRASRASNTALQSI